MAGIPFFRMPSLPGAAFAGDPSSQGVVNGYANGGMFGGGGWQDKLFALGAMLSGHPEMAMQIPMMRLGQQQFQRQQAATADLARYASGKPVPSRAEIAAQEAGAIPGTTAADASGVMSGPSPDMEVTPPASMSGVSMSVPAPRLPMPSVNIPQRDPSADLGGSGPVTVRGAVPFLSHAAQTGVDIKPWVSMLQAAQPSLTNVNGRMVDTNDAGNAGKFFGEAPTKGAEPVYDQNGREVGWRMADGSLQAIQASAQAQAAGTKAGELPFVKPTAQAQAAGTKEGEIPYTLTNQNVNGVPTTMTVQQAIGLATGQQPGAAPATPAAAQAVGDQRLDPKAMFSNFVLKHEGGYNPNDLNGSPVKYGVNQAANPGVDVKNLTPDQAADIFANYFQKSGAGNLPPALAAVHSDTYWINPSKAQQFLAASGGDPQKYMDLREAWLGALAQKSPDAAKYAKAWTQRDADLRALATQLGGAQPQGQGAAPAAAAAPSAPGFHGVNAEDQKKVETYLDDAKQAEEVAKDARQYQELNKQTYTGPLFNPVRIHVPLLGDVPLNPASGIGSAFQPGAQAMDNLSMRMATGLRAPGQRLTQAEIFKNLQTVPNRTSLPASNDASAQTYVDRAATKRAYASFMSNWLAQHGSLQGADDAWTASQKAPQGGASASSRPSGMKAQPMQQIRLSSGRTATVTQVGP
jgi:hypothetical protein